MDVRFRFWISAFFVAALFRASAAASTLPEIPFQYREGLLWVEVNIPQSKKPLHFLVDTGAGVSAINLKTANLIGLELGQKVMVHGVEAMLTGYRQQHMAAQAGDVQLPSEYLAVDLEQLSSSCEQHVDGLLGADFFRGRVIQIDFKAQKIRLLKLAETEKSDEVLPIQFRPCGMRVAIKVDGHAKQWVRLDTGCATPLQWVKSHVRPEQCTGERMAIGLAKISIPQATTTVAIGKYQFEHVPTGLHKLAIFPGEAGLLGNGLLSRFSTVTIDAKAGRLILQDPR